MKILCVYDPSLIFIPYADGRLLPFAKKALGEHDTAQAFFGFKVAFSYAIEDALSEVNLALALTLRDVIADLIYRLANSRNDFHFVPETEGNPFEAQQDETLFADYVPQETINLWQELISYCLESGLHVCYASWSVENGTGEPTHYDGNKDRQLDVVRSRYDWGEAYRQIRRHPASLLPNAFIALSEGVPVFAFRPPEGFFEDEQDLTRSRLPERPGWRRVGGNPRGFEDFWGNFWMWNQGQGHWDVQITEHTKREVGTPDYHLNVHPAGKRAPSDNALIEGYITEVPRLDPEILHRFSIWDRE